MIIGCQIRAARALLNMSQDELAKSAGLTPQAIRKIENGDVQPREGTINDIVKVFTERGVEFCENSGVRFKARNVQTLEGPEGFDTFYDHIYHHLKTMGGDICISGHNAKLFSKFRKDPDLHRKRMMELLKERPDFSVRTLNEEGDDLMPNAAFSKYKWQRKENFPPTSFYVYGSCVGLITFEGANAPYVILIESALFAEAYRKHFKLAWEIAKDAPEPKGPIKTNF